MLKQRLLCTNQLHKFTLRNARLHEQDLSPSMKLGFKFELLAKTERVLVSGAPTSFNDHTSNPRRRMNIVRSLRCVIHVVLVQ